MAELSEAKGSPTATTGCCAPERLADCCEPAEQAGCCSPESSSCGCPASEPSSEKIG